MQYNNGQITHNNAAIQDLTTQVKDAKETKFQDTTKENKVYKEIRINQKYRKE